MAKQKEEKSNQVSMAIRMDAGLRENFKNVCKNNDDDVSKVIRRFMREHIKNNRQGGLL